MLRDRQQRRGGLPAEGRRKEIQLQKDLATRYLLLYLMSNVKRRMKIEEVLGLSADRPTYRRQAGSFARD